MAHCSSYLRENICSVSVSEYPGRFLYRYKTIKIIKFSNLLDMTIHDKPTTVQKKGWNIMFKSIIHVYTDEQWILNCCLFAVISYTVYIYISQRLRYKSVLALHLSLNIILSSFKPNGPLGLNLFFQNSALHK